MEKQLLKNFEQQLRRMASDVGRHLREKDRDGILIERSAETCEQESMAVQRDLAVQSIDRNSLLLREIGAALLRIRNGEYGRCTECDVAISHARLRAVPHAKCCLACQERLDRQPRAFLFRIAA
jgi:RNA polymerase-binding protein DksA